jgi:pimeloyl-ACP methyl ester carboxylesterase
MLVRLADGNGIRPEVYIFDELSRIKAPTLVLWGDRDMAPPEAGQAAAGVIPNGQFVRMEGGGHFPQIEAPELMAKTIIDFLQGS